MHRAQRHLTRAGWAPRTVKGDSSLHDGLLSEVIMRTALLSLIFLIPSVAFAEGACPPGQYPVGGQGVVGCAPIPQGGNSGSASAPRPTGKWETRWGAVVEDNTSSNLATGTAVSRKSKSDAIAAATLVCEEMGGKECKTRITYYNQCVALADPTDESRRGGATQTIASAEKTLELARSRALARCQSEAAGRECSIVYSECSPSEFRKF